MPCELAGLEEVEARRDLAALARVLWWALVALIAVGVLGIVVSIPAGAVVYALAGSAGPAGDRSGPNGTEQAARSSVRNAMGE